MSDQAIIVEGISKKYKIGQLKATSIADKIRNIGQSKKDNVEDEFWALRDISFEVKKGEAIGIIGKNGAGKSTLLKILSRITEPTSGRFEMDGRVSSLLEVGTGFHPELSGRENIFLNGTILGMKRQEIKAKFDEIVDFSGVAKFLDTPVKHYSSGMRVRLAFAVAAHLEPEILIIDEVLAVGDAEFQKKCLGKMDEVTKAGRTVIFVSHNMGAVDLLCSKTVVLKSGTVTFCGATSDGIRKYLNDGNTLINRAFYSEDRLGNQEVVFRGCKILNEHKVDLGLIYSGKKAFIELQVEVLTDKTLFLDVGWSIHDGRGDLLANNYSRFQGENFQHLQLGVNTLIFLIESVPFNKGEYSVRGRILNDGELSDWPKFDLTRFSVDVSDIYGSGKLFDLKESKIIVKGKWVK